MIACCLAVGARDDAFKFEVSRADCAAMSNLEKEKVGDLKKKLKEVGLAQNGEKPDLINRLKQHAAGESLKLDGENPACLKAGPLKKALAVRGLPCSLDIETRDVLVGRLIDALKKEGGGSGGGEAGSSAAGGDAGDSPEEEALKLAVDMAKQVLALGEGGDPCGVLSLAGAAITTATPFAQQRKAYLNLSRMIHPDKLGRVFDGATRAFQELVRAFDELTAPPERTEDAGGGKKGKEKQATISRSNQNCHRTKVFCPRCSAEWATADSGLEKYDYNLMMQGLKLYCCAACLCEFGCVSAKHKCPHCNGGFAYHPKDFHRHVSCGSKVKQSTAHLAPTHNHLLPPLTFFHLPSLCSAAPSRARRLVSCCIRSRRESRPSCVST